MPYRRRRLELRAAISWRRLLRILNRVFIEPPLNFRAILLCEILPAITVHVLLDAPHDIVLDLIALALRQRIVRQNTASVRGDRILDIATLPFAHNITITFRNQVGYQET